MKQDILNHPYHFKLLLEIFQFILLLTLLSLLAFLSTGSRLFKSMFDKGCCSCFVIIFFPILQQIQAISVLNTVSFTIDSLLNIANLQDLIIGNTILIELSCFNIAAVSRTAWRVERLMWLCISVFYSKCDKLQVFKNKYQVILLFRHCVQANFGIGHIFPENCG